MLQRAIFLLPCDGYISLRLLRTVWNRHWRCHQKLYKTGLMGLETRTCLVLGRRRATGPLEIGRPITFFLSLSLYKSGRTVFSCGCSTIKSVSF